MSKFVFNHLAKNDWARYRIIRLRALQDAPDSFARTYVEEAEFSPAQWKARLSGQSTAIIGVLSQEDVGLVSGAALNEREGYAGLFGMWVAKSARGSGLSDHLVGFVVDWARNSGFAYLTLDVADTNDRAIKLYTRLGFEPTGVCGNLPYPREYITEHELRLAL